MKALWTILGVTLAATGCEKDGGMPAAKGSGALSASEADLLAHLPAGGDIVFGGNYFGLQDWTASSPLGRMSKQIDPISAKWNACLARTDFTMAGAGGFSDGVLRMAMYMKGIDLGAFEKCSRDAGLPVAADPDGKFLTVTLENRGGMTLAMPYLAVPGGVYTVVSMRLEPGTITPVGVDLGRADLEREQATLTTANLATDPRMTAWLAKVDRARTFFFVGSGDATPWAEQVGLVYGGMDLGDGITFDVTVDVRADGGADQVVSGWKRARSELGRLPPSMQPLKDAMKSVRLGKTKDGVRVVARISNAQLEAVTAMLAPMMPQP
jgi:hypothetical protein